jgi:glucosamine--fructose-6-phosphate aminotransferase (isomerizing)
MCGLIGIVLPYDKDARADLAPLRRALESLAGFDAGSKGAALALDATAKSVEPVAAELVLWPGLRALLGNDAEIKNAAELARLLVDCAEAIDKRLALGLDSTTAAEPLAAAAIRARDAAWRIEQDALENLKKVADLLGADGADATAGDKLLFELWRFNLIMNQLDRLEVRGRDSSGLGTLVHFTKEEHARFEAAIAKEGLGHELRRRLALHDFRDGSIVVSAGMASGPTLGFAHKIAREVGELGLNVRELRARARRDRIFRLALGANATVQIFAHTRWASNGIINEANCHPLTNEVEGGIASQALVAGTLPRVVLGALNGDIDNYPELAARHSAETARPIPAGITTDAKIIPVEVDRRTKGSGPPAFEAAFADALRSFEGSVAVGAIGSDAPLTYALALRGSGQAIYVGRLPLGGYIFASELYGLVEVADRYYKLNGESERVPGEPLSRGDIVFLREGQPIHVARYDGVPVVLAEKDWKRAQITTRDIDRAGFEHYLLKEITESPRSVRKTLRGKFVIAPGERGQGEKARFLVGPDVIPDAVKELLLEKKLRKIFVIGQGTACVAARAVADFMGSLYAGKGIEVRGMPATELSGFHLENVDAATLIIAISQSGTTTDTNRTVDVARQNGAHVLAVVNRRNSDLVDKSHGVLYTSDGRDVEMSVASTKAFYCQVVGGYILALALADAGGLQDFSKNADAVRILRELSDMPRRMEDVLAAARDRIRLAAQLALPRRHWALVGSGPLRHAADEIRIKLSELCYKSIAVDTIEDKKHIDLSSEPLILVCAAGLSGAAAADAVKEVAIFRAHHAAPIVVCDRGETRFSEYALATIEVPPASPHLALLLNALVGHLFGYECAKAIDALGSPLRRAREATEAALTEIHGGGDEGEPASYPLDSTRLRYRAILEPLAREALDACARGRWNCAVDPELTVRLANALRLALGHLSAQAPLSLSPTDDRTAGAFTFEGALEHALQELTRSIDGLRRPIDAIKHQAKTVTVGISRDAPGTRTAKGVVATALAEAGADLTRILDQDGAALAALGPAIAAVQGATVYAITNLDPLGAPTNESKIQVVKKTGIAVKIRSRADRGADLSGTKRKLVTAPRIHVCRGERDKRALIMCPLYERGIVRGLGLLHVDFVDALATRERVRALKAVGRYEDIRCAVTEVDIAWDDRLVDPIALDELLTAPVERIAEAIVKIAKAAGEAAPVDTR